MALPAGAKKLTGAEIAELFLGNTKTFENYTQDKPLTGEVSVSEKGELSGKWTYDGKKSGKVVGTARAKGDQWCFELGGAEEECVAIYVDGADIYEVNSGGKVTAKLLRK